jgi:hypothetical protein
MNWLNSILLLLAAFVAVFLESVFGGVRNLFGAQIDLLPALMVYAALATDIVTVSLLAVCGGLWFDTLSANPLGITIMPLFVVGLIIYLRRGLILREQFYAQLVIGLVASAAVPAMVLLLLSGTRQTPLLGWQTVWQWLVLGAGGGVLTPVCFRLFDGLSYSLNYRPVTESSFRPDREIRRGRN